jgi:hypothetical protein
MKNALVIAATFGLAITTGFVIAQTAPPAPTNTPPSASPPPTDTPPTDDSMANPSTNSRTNNMPARNHPSSMTPMPPDFATIDRNGTGYVTQQDAAMSPWLQKNFTSCDADRNGQVSRAEYMTCSKNH